MSRGHPHDMLAELQIPKQRARSFGQHLLRWYEKHRRDLPWRGRNQDPYVIWVSELMLQQTQVTTVIPYFNRWMQRFPTIRRLAEASEDEVLHAWQGLGYYRRARHLLAGARLVCEQYGGEMPRDMVQLRALPGVGPYSAGAIASIAFEQAEPIVDGNVIRVLTRVFGLRGDPARSPLKQQLWSLARHLLVKGRASDFNQGLMELGATVCVPRRPLCLRCPVRAQCVAHAQDTIGELPELKKRPTATAVRMAAAAIRHRGRWLIVQLGPDAPRWATMWQFPSVEVDAEEDPEAAARRAASELAAVGIREARELCTIRHSVTRYRIELNAFEAQRAPSKPGRAAAGIQAVKWKTLNELADLAMPAAHRRIVKALVESRG